jgi:hypothetical protein
MSAAVTVLWRQSVTQYREYVKSLEETHEAEIVRTTAASTETVRILQAVFADQIKIARDDNAQMKAAMYEAMAMARKSLDTLRDRKPNVHDPA